ncbi:MAG: hypothetical protein FWG98_01755 [Candidatus Cloacimonetes bacterium]|nr:hypothetical protein [Candidatus Cloacimonadota bacterium]
MHELENCIETPGGIYLKIIGIIYIICSVVGIFSLMILMSLFEDPFFQDLINEIGQTDPDMMLFFSVQMMQYGMVWLVFTLFVGIMGVIFSRRADKGTLIMYIGLLNLFLIIISQILLITKFDMSASFGILISLILPVLYLVGALKNKKSFESNLVNRPI